MQLALYNDRPSSAAIAAQFAEARILTKLRALDSRARRKGTSSLERGRNLLIDIGMEADAAGRVTKNSYGVFHLSWLAESHPEWPEMVGAELDELKSAMLKAHGRSLRFLIWAGMGGSAEDKSAYAACGLLKKGPRVYVLDSTDPAKLKAILEDITARSGGSLPNALRSSLIVGQALGMTSYEPVVNLEKLAALYDRHKIDSRSNFVYMTLPNSLLDQFGASRGYRKIELQLDNGNSTSGRHSSPLTRGSLYPLGLAGADLAGWIRGTFLSEEAIHTAWQFGSFLHQQGAARRDKVTLVTSKSLAGIGLWTKQNFEESLGKSEHIGLKIIIGEKLKAANYRSMKDPAQDRVFVGIARKGEPFPEKAKLQMLRRAGYPVAILTIPTQAPLSSYMQFIHYTVFALGWVRRMNFVTQPSVELYKAITAPIANEAARTGGIEKTSAWQGFSTSSKQAKWRGGVTLHWDRLLAGVEVEGSAPSIYAQLLGGLTAAGKIEYGELTYFGDTRYSKPGLALRKVLDQAADTVFRNRFKIPVDVYEGPAMNHSYHEMVIGHGRCLTTVLLSEKAEKIPAAGYTADYHRAQFLATQQALAERGRYVVAITLKDLEASTREALAEFFREAAKTKVIS